MVLRPAEPEGVCLLNDVRLLLDQDQLVLQLLHVGLQGRVVGTSPLKVARLGCRIADLPGEHEDDPEGERRGRYPAGAPAGDTGNREAVERERGMGPLGLEAGLEFDIGRRRRFCGRDGPWTLAGDRLIG